MEESNETINRIMLDIIYSSDFNIINHAYDIESDTEYDNIDIYGMNEDNAYGIYNDGTYDDGIYDDGIYDDGTYNDGVYDDGIYNEMDEILNTSFMTSKNKYKNVLSDEEIIKPIKYKKDEYKKDEKNTTCPIMTTMFEENQDVIQLPCSHIFDAEAIKRWLTEEKAECPVCRYNKFQTKEIKEESTQINNLTQILIQYQDYQELIEESMPDLLNID
jgi:hypothetical protein